MTSTALCHGPGLASSAGPGSRLFCEACERVWPCPAAECRNCGHTLDCHADRAIYACPTAVRALMSPWRRVVCPCPGFAYGQAASVPLPPLLPPPDHEILSTLESHRRRERSILDRLRRTSTPA